MKPLRELMKQLIEDLVCLNGVKSPNLMPVSFWFYSDCEENLSSLSETLKDHGYSTSIARILDQDRSTWLCIARLELIMDYHTLSELALRLRILADTYAVEYDGWEICLDN